MANLQGIGVHDVEVEAERTYLLSELERVDAALSVLG